MSKVVAAFLVLCIITAVLRVAVIALAVALLLFLLAAFVTRPRETIAYVISLASWGLVSARPIACIVTFGIIVLAMVVMDAFKQPKRLNRDLLG